LYDVGERVLTLVQLLNDADYLFVADKATLRLEVSCMQAVMMKNIVVVVVATAVGFDFDSIVLRDRAVLVFEVFD
jgi:hypothetical protein